MNKEARVHLNQAILLFAQPATMQSTAFASTGVSGRGVALPQRVGRTSRLVARAELYSGKGIKPPVKGKHFMHLDDFTKEELQNMLDLGLMAKKKFYARDESFKPFAGQTMAMIFTKPSARTRVSFETVGAGFRAPSLIFCRAAQQAPPCSLSSCIYFCSQSLAFH